MCLSSRYYRLRQVYDEGRLHPSHANVQGLYTGIVRFVNSFCITQHTDIRGAHSISVSYDLGRLSNVRDYAVQSYREDDCLPPLPTKLMPPTTRRPRGPCPQNARRMPEVSLANLRFLQSVRLRSEPTSGSTVGGEEEATALGVTDPFSDMYGSEAELISEGWSRIESRYIAVSRKLSQVRPHSSPPFPHSVPLHPYLELTQFICAGGRAPDWVGEKGRLEEGGGKGAGSGAAAERVPSLPSPTSASKTLTLLLSQYRNSSDCSRMASTPVRLLSFFPPPLR